MEEEFENPNKENESPNDLITLTHIRSNRPPLMDITEVLYPK